jgi:G3E family GTPase
MDADSHRFTQPLVPVTVLTGFLGSGKTTLLARLLRDPGFARTAVIVNEFGEVGLDHELLEQSREELVLLDNGCVCCTVREDLVETLARLHAQKIEVAIDRVAVETTGLADPAPILHTLIANPRVTDSYRLDQLVTTVDAFNALATLDQHPVARSQVALADRLLLTKLDLVDPAMRGAVETRLRALNRVAPIHESSHGAVDPGWLFSPGRSVEERLAADPWLREHADAHDHDHTDDDHADPHGDIRSFAIVRDEPIAWARFEAWLEMIRGMRGADLLRVKGIVNVADRLEGPVVIHGVQHVFHPPRFLERWPGADRRTRLVFITRNIERDDIEATLEVFEHRRM